MRACVVIYKIISLCLITCKRKILYFVFLRNLPQDAEGQPVIIGVSAWGIHIFHNNRLINKFVWWVEMLQLRLEIFTWASFILAIISADSLLKLSCIPLLTRTCLYLPCDMFVCSVLLFLLIWLVFSFFFINTLSSIYHFCAFSSFVVISGRRLWKLLSKRRSLP